MKPSQMCHGLRLLDADVTDAVSDCKRYAAVHDHERLSAARANCYGILRVYFAHKNTCERCKALRGAK